MNSRTHGPVISDLKAADGSERVIKGYGSVFGNTDLQGDVIVKGAFASSLKRKKPLMLYAHDPNEILGVWDVFREDARGLYVEGRLAGTQRGRETYGLLRMGALKGLSVGFRTVSATPNKSGVGRTITEADLWEVSVCAFPANEAAGVESVRSQQAPSVPVMALGTLRYLVTESLPAAVYGGDGLTDWQAGKVVECAKALLPFAQRGDLSPADTGRMTEMFDLVAKTDASARRAAMVKAWQTTPRVTREPDGAPTMAGRRYMTAQMRAIEQHGESW